MAQLECAIHWLSQRDPVPHNISPPIHPNKAMLCIWWRSWQAVHVYQRTKPSLQICTRNNCNMCNDSPWQCQVTGYAGGRGYHTVTWLGDNCAIHLTPRTLLQHITIPFHSLCNISQMNQTWGKHSQTFLRSSHLIFTYGCASAGMYIRSECRQFCCIIFFLLINHKWQRVFR